MLRRFVPLSLPTVLALAVTACTTTPAGDGLAASFTGTANGYHGPAADLTSYVSVAPTHRTGDSSPMQMGPVEIGSGRIAADGSFAFELLDPPPADVLWTVEDVDYDCSGPTVDDPEARIVLSGDITVLDASGEITGMLVRTENDPNLEFTHFDTTVRFYTDRPLRIAGACETDFATWIFDLSLAAGWNIVTIELVGEDEIRFRVGDNTSAAWWHTDYWPFPLAKTRSDRGASTSGPGGRR